MASDRLCGDKKTSRQIVLLDTSAILMLFEHRINLESELTRLLGSYEIIIIKPVVEELKNLYNYGHGKQKKNAKPALKLINKYKILDGDNILRGDDAIVNFAVEHNAIVVTNDKELRKRLKNKKLGTIYLRNKSYLVLN